VVCDITICTYNDRWIVIKAKIGEVNNVLTGRPREWVRIWSAFMFSFMKLVR
jgi:hypothetical protein